MNAKLLWASMVALLCASCGSVQKETSQPFNNDSNGTAEQVANTQTDSDESLSEAPALEPIQTPEVASPEITSEDGSEPTLVSGEEPEETKVLDSQDSIAHLTESTEIITDEVAITLDSLIPEPSYQIRPKKMPVDPDILDNAGKTPTDLCRELGEKLGSVDESDCLAQNLIATYGKSVEGRDLAVKNYLPKGSREPLGKILVIGGIHGDEFSSVSVVFRWMEILDIHHSGLFNWRFIPAANPDGLLQTRSQRQNANGVDLNRNFPTTDWNQNAKNYWINKAGKQPRRYPGESANSEPETQWLVSQINDFKPDVIISMHAPYHLVDYDGPPSAPNQLGSLYLRQLGVFPGSLGNYAGVDLNIPIVTVELASAGSMPSQKEISDMWDDLVSWLRTKLESPAYTTN